MPSGQDGAIATTDFSGDDGLSRLESLIRSNERVSAQDYVDLLRKAGRPDPERLLRLGARAYTFGLQQAFRDGDVEGLVEVAIVGALLLDASGVHDQAIGRLEQAATMVSENPAAGAQLTSTTAWYEALSGRLATARQSIDAAEALVTRLDGARMPGERAMFLCAVLEPDAVESLETAVARSRDEGAEARASSLMVHLIATYAVLGRTAEAHETADALRQHATAVDHRAREIDAEVASIALEARRGRAEVPEGLAGEAERLMNNHALWKLLVATFRQHVLRGEHAAAEAVHSQLLKHHNWLNRGYHNAFSGLKAYHVALFEADERVELPLPETPTLFSVDHVLASAEAVALGGSMSAAADWIAWLDAELPPDVVTSLEWPACRARVEALLRLRVGQRAEALTLFRAGIGCCEDRGDAIEAEIGRAQLAAIAGDDHERVLAMSRLAGAGIDAMCFTAAAARVAERAALMGDQILSLGEARVLGRLARGLSYREIEADVGLPTRGAARPIATSYGKLGASGRLEAIRLAQERQIA